MDHQERGAVHRTDQPRPRLTREVVLAEAMALLDDEGYDALTMRRLAERLGVVPMAVYRHVTNKDDLVDAMLDRAVSLVPLPDQSLGWRAGLEALARAIRATVLAHPGIVTPLVTKPSLGPHGLLLGEFGLAVMRRAGFPPEDAERGPTAVLTYTLGFVALEVPRRAAGFRADGLGGDELDVPFDQLPPEQFPHTIAVRPRAAELVSDAQFEYGLQRVLDGIGLAAPGRRATRPKRSAPAPPSER
jgi:AcrR family transcriptional regulator